MGASGVEEGVRRRLTAILERAQRGDVLGPGPIGPHLDHAEAFAVAAGPPRSFVDLGSGAGLPGLVLAALWPEATAVLVESRRDRAALVEVAARELGLEDRCRVRRGRAEELARDPELRGRFELVVARGFGPPATTAECAVGFLQVGGLLVVSEPPGPPDRGRWPPGGVARVGLEGPSRVESKGFGFAVLELVEPDDGRWPRRTALPAKQPLWG
jgi:16S rRNA (guanine527-N7)-methyltransferase